MISVSQQHLSDLYDALLSFESRNKNGHYPIHKSVSIDGKELLEWVMGKIALKPRMKVLDAGCGTGHTLFNLASRVQMIDGLGISISQREVDFACSLASAKNSDLTFQTRDMEAPIDDLGKFDLIFAIESLKHIGQPVPVIHSLCDALKAEGQLVILDDYLYEFHSSRTIAQHKKLWSAPGFISRQNMAAVLDHRKDITYEVIDLSKHVKTKHYWHIIAVERLLALITATASTLGITFRNLLTYRGAMLLEQLYKQQRVGYFFWIITKKSRTYA